MKSFWSWLTEANNTVAVSVMVPVWQGKALILRRGPTAPWKPGLWNLPGGIVDPGESPLQAAIRECQEEAGVTVSGIKRVGAYNETGYMLYAFTGQSSSDKAVLTPTDGILENDAWEWVDESNIGQFQFAIPTLVDIVMQSLRMHANASHKARRPVVQLGQG